MQGKLEIIHSFEPDKECGTLRVCINPDSCLVLAYKKRGKHRANRMYKSEFYTESLMSPETKAFALGLGIGVLSMALFPQVREKIIPTTDKAMQSVKDLANHLTGVVQNMKEGLEDIASEAKFEDLKQSIEQEITPRGQNV